MKMSVDIGVLAEYVRSGRDAGPWCRIQSYRGNLTEDIVTNTTSRFPSRKGDIVAIPSRPPTEPDYRGLRILLRIGRGIVDATGVGCPRERCEGRLDA